MFVAVNSAIKNRKILDCAHFASRTFLRQNKLKIAGKRKLKGLGHAILGNFSTDQMVIELTKILK